METENMRLAKELLQDMFTLANALTVNRRGFSSADLPVGKSQFRALHLIDHLDLHTIADIHKFTNISVSTLSIHMSKLAKDGYLRKERPNDHEDGRKKFFYLTDKGRAAIKQFHQIVLSDFSEIYIRLSEEKRVYLYRGIIKMHRIFDSLNNSLEDGMDEQS